MSVSWRRRGGGASRALLLPAFVVIALSTSPSIARAEPPAPSAAAPGTIDTIVTKPAAAQPSTLFGFGANAVAAPAHDELDLEGGDVAIEDLERVADYHPETDRWTDRNDRIKIGPYVAGWFFSDNLRVKHDVAVGLNVTWEVPGFIGIRLNVGVVPWSRMKVHVPNGARIQGYSERWIDGYVANASLSLGIFNPELSTPLGPLAFWAGFTIPPFDLWYWNYRETLNVNNRISEWTFNKLNVGGFIFLEFDLKIMDIFHVELGFREHIIYAPQVKQGGFVKENGQEQDPSNAGRGNVGLATVQDIYLQLTVLF